jgi:transposase-like protein
MGDIRKRYSAQFKAKIALEAVRQEKTLAQLSSEYGVHTNQIAQWKKQLIDGLPGIFSCGRKKAERESEEIQGELYRQIGRLKVELDWLKKKHCQLG